ncbi:MAG: hypothetical protein B6230_01900 [Desulfobacteraceae bacterium 4572_89]|nr:MAG: hypothetical protein B6230_01900 [Desulfobacteraceae bacterium 4572_89]
MNTHTPRILSAIFRQLQSRPSLENVGIKEYRDSLEKSARTFKLDPAIQFHPFPSGLVDLQNIYDWLVQSTPPTTRISLVGDSAGAGLGLAFLTSCFNRNTPLPACAALMSPWADLTCKNKSFETNQGKDPMLNHKQLAETARLYTNKSLCHPLVSPLYNTFKGFPPLLIQAGENEVLVDDSKILAEKIENAGGKVTLEIWDGMFHVWHYFARYLSQGQKAIKVIGKFIQQHS